MTDPGACLRCGLPDDGHARHVNGGWIHVDCAAPVAALRARVEFLMRLYTEGTECAQHTGENTPPMDAWLAEGYGARCPVCDSEYIAELEQELDEARTALAKSITPKMDGIIRDVQQKTEAAARADERERVAKWHDSEAGRYYGYALEALNLTFKRDYERRASIHNQVAAAIRAMGDADD